MMRPYLPGGVPPRYAASHDPLTIAVAVLGVAGLGLGAYQAFRPQPQMPKMQQPNVPGYQDPAVQAAAMAQQRAAQEAKGRGSTILTGGMGETDQVQTAKKATLGA